MELVEYPLTPGQRTAGIALHAQRDAADPLLAHVQLQWLLGAPSATLLVQGPDEVAVSSEIVFRKVPAAQGAAMQLEAQWDALKAGGTSFFTVDLHAVAEGDDVVVVAERSWGEMLLQVTVAMRVEQDRVTIFRPQAYRISNVVHRAMAQKSAGSFGATAGYSGNLLVESLDQPKVLAEAFVEDNTDYAIPDGPYDCASDNPNWSVERFVNISSAPSGAIATAITIHLTIIHPDMSDLQIGAFKNYSGVFLWRYGAGVNLNQDFTTDMYGHALPGYGGAVNGLYSLAVRDCYEYNQGTLDYWSLRIAYAADSIDLVADSISVSPSSVSAGGTVNVVFSGHAGGSGSVGGAFPIGFYLSSDSNVTTSDQQLEQEWDTWASSAGDTFGQSSPGLSVSIPGSVAAGTYFLGMIVDDDDVITESNESNNTQSTILTVTDITVNQPNLNAVSCSLSTTSASPGDTVTVTSRGQNNGTAATGAFAWSLWLSSDAVIDPSSDTNLKSQNVPGGWAAGYDSGNVNSSISLSSGLAAGTYYIGVYYDSGFAVTESNESDNSCSQTITVSSSSTPSGVTQWLVPAAASLLGNPPNDWKTQISVVNPTSSTKTANIYYVEGGTAWPGVLLSGPHNITANHSVYLDDPLLALNPTSGLIYVTLDAAGPVVSTRTYNLLAGGVTYGQGIPAIPITTHSPSVIVIPLVHNWPASNPSRFYTHLGLVQASSGTFQVEVTIHHKDGPLLATKTYSSSAAFRQINDIFVKMGIGEDWARGSWIKVRLISGSPSFWTAYASVVHYASGDPTYVLGVEPVE